MTVRPDLYQLRDLLVDQEPVWERLPHQEPPTGDWFGWILEAGRGTGKSLAANMATRDHLNGPACINGNTPHRVALIAPTIGDAAETAALMPGSLTDLQPGTKLSTQTGGSFIRWPDGSQIRLFGVHTRDDVERLRAGGNRSLPAGTMISTENGPIPIESVTVGTNVYTTAGLRPVLARWNHGDRPVWTITTERGYTLQLTRDHEVWTESGWVRCDQLVVGSNITTWNGVDTVGRNLATDIGHGQSNAMADRRRCLCTASSMKRRSARSPVDTSFITSTTTKAITVPRTSSLYHLATITPNTTQDGSGMLLEVKPRPSQLRTVNNAVQNSKATATPDSVANPAGAHFSVTAPPPLGCGHVWCAASTFAVPPGPPPSLVADRVATISPGNAVKPVWDLTVAGEHAFVANGIYVSNCWVHAEELAAWRYLQEAWDQMMFGLRLGPRPHWILTTTPKARPDYLALVEELEARADVVLTNASTGDNPHLSEQQKTYLYERFDGTSLGGQELHGKRIKEAEGALWSYDLIEPNRLTTHLVETEDAEPYSILGRLIVGVDPPGGATECGIVAAATITTDCLCGEDTPYPHFAVVADASAKLSPNGWANRSIATYRDWDADLIVGEANYGGDMVESNIRTVDTSVSYENVHASRGKRIRAEPIKALYEQGRVHHIGTFPELEAEMVQWIPDESSWSPNRIDALVWALTELAETGEPQLWFV